MELKRNFLQAIMDKDSDDRIMPPGRMRDAYNIRVANSEGADVGSIENCLGNEKLTELTLGDNPITIGADKSLLLNNIYWLVKSDDRCCFIEFNTDTQTVFKVLEDTRTGTDNVLNLHEDYHVDRIIIIEDTDNDAYYAVWTDNRNEVRFVNIERAKTYGTNGFSEEDITLIKKPPYSMPILTLENTGNEKENNLEEKPLRFAYQYKYLDNQYSALSPFTEVAFLPKTFNYNYSSNSNESMINAFNQAKLTLNTGSDLVTDIKVVFKESSSNAVYWIEEYNKDDEGWADDASVDVIFNNHKNRKTLAPDEINRLSDNIPRKAGASEYIGNQIMLADYTENYDIAASNGTKRVIDLELDYDSAAAVTTPQGNVKSIRSYEAGVAYLDRFGRMTPVLTSKNNTTAIPGSEADRQKQLSLTIGHFAPSFAVGYRLFIKQSREDYDTLVPTLFYQDQNFIWIKLEAGEQDKIAEGDYLIVKSDSSGLLDSYVETRVLEIKQQEANFLETDPAITDILQRPGLYFKIDPDGFRINEADFEKYEWKSYDDSDYENPISGEVNVIETAVYYGDGTLDDLTAGGSYTNDTEDIRYLVRIDSLGTPDTFEWSDDDGANWTTGVAITGAAQTLNNGVTVTFGNTTGHDLNDNWVVSAKGNDTNDFGDQEDDRAYAVIKGPPDDIIYGGARIQLTYYEFNRHNLTVVKEFIASQEYDNLEEWFFGDNITSEFGDQFNAYWFRRGTVAFASTRNLFTQDPAGDMCMIIRSIGAEAAGERAKLEVRATIFQSDTNILLETKSVENLSDIYYEIGQTYDISPEGYHLGNTVDDTDQGAITDAVIKIPFVNCYTWGNGFESHKIKDAFNGKKIGIDTRPWTTVDDYKENRRTSGIIYSGVFNQSNRYNALNEFNQSLFNFIELDDAYGPIVRMHAKDTDLIAIQENRLQPLGYRKTEVFDQNGNPSLTKSNEVLSILRSYGGEFGMKAESFAHYGNRLYGADPKRGTPIRLSINGITEISMYGMVDYFKDIFRQYPNARFEGGYDPYFDEYLLTVSYGLNAKKQSFTLGFSEQAKGWTSRYAFVPEKMVGLNNLFYSLKNGQLWQHNSENVPRNNFYGSQYTSSVTVIFNESTEDDKIFKALVTMSDSPWDATLTTNLANGVVHKEEFEKRESNYYAFTRRNENTSDTSGMSANGIGNLISIDGNELSFAYNVEYVTGGDTIFQVQSGVEVEIGEVVSVSGKKVVIGGYVNPTINSAYTYSKKTGRYEGGSIRGHFLELKLTNDDTGKAEMFGVNVNTVKSYV